MNLPCLPPVNGPALRTWRSCISTGERLAHDSREVAALAAAIERSSKSIGARMQAFAGLDPANPYSPSGKATGLTQSVWGEYLADRTAIAIEGTAGIPWHPEPVLDGTAVGALWLGLTT